jgi:phosphoribosylformimino-5-aminoimidazole carboxamide ribotide isomerase
MTFELFPAIDLRAGRVVRLQQGDFDRETAYSDDPVDQARTFLESGARGLHVVDLDAARTGDPGNRSAIARICEAARAAGGRVQCGGGVRAYGAAEALFAVGVDRVVVGTAAVEDPRLVSRWADRWPDGVAVALDVRGGEVATRGWTAGSGRPVEEVARGLAGSGVAALVVTDIDADGMLSGPGVDTLTRVLAVAQVPVIASGGVGSLDDLRALTDLDVLGRRLAGAVLGRALYEGRFPLVAALGIARDREYRP